VHQFSLGKANRPTCQSLNPGASGQVLALDALGVGFANGMDRRFKMPSISTPIIGVKLGDAKRGQ
jgi:hypothetical protein